MEESDCLMGEREGLTDESERFPDNDLLQLFFSFWSHNKAYDVASQKSGFLVHIILHKCSTKHKIKMINKSLSHLSLTTKNLVWLQSMLPPVT
ncbi:hypothetical protein MTR_6g034365 [Medicago truncatula]|uniref:Uncharacterized protein n=1 Tax=Medicago truncatula TaxID=3880 RepID=A0A072U7X8_MEDTR|nr:hypothetical protein MTR_6g034365 [Medicago truncatula]